MNLITVFNGMGIENENGIFSKFILVYPVIYNYSRMSRRSDGARQRATHTYTHNTHNLVLSKSTKPHTTATAIIAYHMQFRKQNNCY